MITVAIHTILSINEIFFKTSKFLVLRFSHSQTFIKEINIHVL
jgi:hypothetical protein